MTAIVHGVGLPAKNFTGLAHHVDWVPTLVEVAGGRPVTDDGVEPPMDGVSLWSSLMHPHNNTSPRKSVVLNVDPTNQHVLNDPHGWSGYAGIRVGDWKLVLGDPGTPNGWCWPNQNTSASLAAPSPMPHKISCGYNGTVPENRATPMLFNLANDPGERIDVAAAEPVRLAALQAALGPYLASAVTPLNMLPSERKMDPRAKPSLHNNTWTPWMD